MDRGRRAGRPERIGIFGGTFDPPHVGHVEVARDVADHLDLDAVLWIPSGQPPHKPTADVTPGPIRLEMVRLAVEADPRFRVSELELERPGPSYTVDTLEELRSRFPEAELFLILGADQVGQLAGWRAPERVLALARPAILDRAGTRAQEVAPELPGLERAVHVPVRRVDVSSTGVRHAVRAGTPWTAWVPHGVAGVVDRERLYRNG